jgi:hypothetical protein
MVLDGMIKPPALWYAGSNPIGGSLSRQWQETRNVGGWFFLPFGHIFF